MTPAAYVSHKELTELAVMVAESAWAAKDYTASKRAAQMARNLDPEKVEALSRLGRIALLERDYDRAEEYFHRVLDVRSTDSAAAVNLAIAAGCQKRFEHGLTWCDFAILHNPDFLPAHIHRAALFEEMGRLAEAEAAVVESLKLFPGNAELTYALSLYQLKRGDFENGWINYELRPPRLELAAKLDEYPEWHGEDLIGKTILVCGEQGLGDQIMFARYIPLLEHMGADVVLFTMPELARLFAAAFPRIDIFTSDTELKGLEPDYWIAMASLPLRWRQFEAIDVVSTPIAEPLALPYLWQQPDDVTRFASMFPLSGNLKVGLCWKGNPKHRRDEYRSMKFEDVKPLLDIPGVDFYSLQRGDTESGLVNLAEYCHDIADTAAAIANLDLVITVDTAMLHLAGAMAKPVWGLIYTPGDWRWGNGRSESTGWYGSAALFHQQNQMAWGDVIETIRARLIRVERASRLDNRRRDASVWLIWQEATTITRDCRYGAMTWLRNDHYIGRALDLYGEYSESETVLLQLVLHPGDTVVEAGANVGGLTLPMAKEIWPGGVVHAFEPQPAYVDCLRKNAQRSPGSCLSAIEVHHAALGATEGFITLRSVEEEKIHAPGWESTGPEFEVSLATIDGLNLPACDLIKIDVDGAEHEILFGAEATIDRCRPLIYVEHDKPQEYPEMLAWLVGKGYRLYRHAAPLYNPDNFRGSDVNVFGSIVSLMILAVPAERKDLHPVDWGLERLTVQAS